MTGADPRISAGFPPLAILGGRDYIFPMRRLFAALALMFFPLSAALAGGVELVMFEQPGCIYCARWNRDIAPIYPKTPEGAKAPLRRVDIADKAAYGVALKGPVVYTPTFVVSVDGHETARMEGYASDQFFWGLLTQHLAAVPPASQARE